jgi:hypothetical protein
MKTYLRLERDEAALHGAGSAVFAAVMAAIRRTGHAAVMRAATPAGAPSFTVSPIPKRPELGDAVGASTVGKGEESGVKPKDTPLTEKLDAAEETIAFTIETLD